MTARCKAASLRAKMKAMPLARKRFTHGKHDRGHSPA